MKLGSLRVNPSLTRRIQGAEKVEGRGMLVKKKKKKAKHRGHRGTRPGKGGGRGAFDSRDKAGLAEGESLAGVKDTEGAEKDERGVGCLYLVATPIGNLEDMTLRGLRVLKEVDAIACEDTRRTQQLLEHYEIRKRLVSYHEHNELMRSAELVIEMEQGARVALVSDAGMPVISDPGHRLVTLCVRHKIAVVPVPGASAAVAALAASGLASDEFLFVGFLPARSGERRRAYERLASEARTIVMYEAPQRLRESLLEAREVLGNRQAVIAREVTKMHEEFLRGRLGELIERMGKTEPRGEITVVIAAADAESGAGMRVGPEMSLEERVAALEGEGKMDRKAALKQAARERGMTRREAYKRMLGMKGDGG